MCNLVIFNLGYRGSFSSNVGLERAAKYSVSCYQHVLVEKLSLLSFSLSHSMYWLQFVCVCVRACVCYEQNLRCLVARGGGLLWRNKPDKYLFFLFGAFSPIPVELFIVIHLAKSAAVRLPTKLHQRWIYLLRQSSCPFTHPVQ